MEYQKRRRGTSSISFNDRTLEGSLLGAEQLVAEHPANSSSANKSATTVLLATALCSRQDSEVQIVRNKGTINAEQNCGEDNGT